MSDTPRGMAFRRKRIFIALFSVIVDFHRFIEFRWQRAYTSGDFRAKPLSRVTGIKVILCVSIRPRYRVIIVRAPYPALRRDGHLLSYWISNFVLYIYTTLDLTSPMDNFCS